MFFEVMVEEGKSEVGGWRVCPFDFRSEALFRGCAELIRPGESSKGIKRIKNKIKKLPYPS